MTATETIVLYDSLKKVITAEVYQGEKYYIPDTISVFIGTIEEFLILNPEYEFHN